MSDKEQEAIKRLQLAAKMSERYYKKPLLICYSGGKDSEVVLELAKRAEIPFEVQHSHTTADAPETVYHVRDTLNDWKTRELRPKSLSLHIKVSAYQCGV